MNLINGFRIRGLMVNRIKEYLRLGRLFNAEIISLLYILSYILASKLNGFIVDYRIVGGLFIVGILSHIWGCYNNDRLDLSIDKKADYCSHKPLVSGSISIQSAKKIEFSILIIIIFLLIIMSPRISTIIYFIGSVVLAYSYNRYNKSNMFINIVGQMYASFAVLVGMSFVIDFDYIVFISAIVVGLNGVYLNIIEADLKDIKGDIVNVPKSLGLRITGKKVENITNFYLLNEIIKSTMYLLVFYILILEGVELIIKIIALFFFGINFFIRAYMFKMLSANREKMKSFIAVQEITSILFISTIYIFVHPVMPIVIVFFVIIWLTIWNKLLWGTYIRPQV
jgi:4-hydroxybenzoate polyprenyltransferase